MRFFTVEQVAEMFDVKPSTVYRWVRRGDLAAIRKGTRFTRISEAHLQAFTERHEVSVVRLRAVKRSA